MTKDYTNWKTESKTLTEEQQNEYTEVAEWCNESGQYHIEDMGEYYAVVENTPPSPEELKQQEIQQLKQYLQETDYIVIKIAEGEEPTAHTLEIISRRKEARARINELEAELEV